MQQSLSKAFEMGFWRSGIKQLRSTCTDSWQLFKDRRDHLPDFRCWKKQLTGSIIAIAVYWLKPCLKEVWQKTGTITSLSLHDPSSQHHIWVQPGDSLTKLLLQSFGQMLKPQNWCHNGLFLCDTIVWCHVADWSIRHRVYLCWNLKMLTSSLRLLLMWED